MLVTGILERSRKKNPPFQDSDSSASEEHSPSRRGFLEFHLAGVGFVCGVSWVVTVARGQADLLRQEGILCEPKMLSFEFRVCLMDDLQQRGWDGEQTC